MAVVQAWTQQPTVFIYRARDNSFGLKTYMWNLTNCAILIARLGDIIACIGVLLTLN